MEEIISTLTEFNWISVIVRMLLAAIAGGLVGAERGMHGREAGMRTHMLVCMGAALTTLLGVYNVEVLGVTWADPLRVGAQVISGVGFIGAGTIMFKKGSTQIRGLTTAAGLWATAVIGLSIGVGFYLGALLTTAFVLSAFVFVAHLEAKMRRKRQMLFVYLELRSVEAVTSVIDYIKKTYGAVEVQVTPPRSGSSGNVGIEGLIKLPREQTVEERIRELSEIDQVAFAIRAA